MTKESSERWTIEEVVAIDAMGMGSSSSGSLIQSISDASRSLPSGPIAQPSGGIVSQGDEGDGKPTHGDAPIYTCVEDSKRSGRCIRECMTTRTNTGNVSSLQGPQTRRIVGIGRISGMSEHSDMSTEN